MYSVVSIRLETDAGTAYSSGVYLYIDSKEYIVSLCPHLLPRMAAEHKISVALLSSLTYTSVIWDNVELVGSAPLTQTAIFISKFNGFKSRPAEPAQVTLFKFSSFSAQRVRQQSLHPEPLTLSKPSAGSAVHIESSPFGGNHLFLGFNSHANVAMVDDSQNVLLDARYMDDMSGGVVYDSHGSIGLVQCELAKVGGEGKFVVVVPWMQILGALELAKLSTLPLVFASGESKQLEGSSTVAVHVKLRAGRRAWGSGVIVRPDIVATNRHVIDNHLSITVQLESGELVPAFAVAEPIKGVDMVFLKLQSELKVPAAQLAPVPAIGSPITSRGFGLVYPGKLGKKGKVQPLASAGVVAARHSFKFYSEQQTSSLAMFVSTAGCWNGSSGGGIYHEGKLVGLMASNARDEETGEIMPDMAFAIPSNVVQLGLECINTRDEKKIQANPSMERLWSLRPILADSKRQSKL